MATPSLAMIPSGYKASKVYSVLPESGVGDFDFTRATTATRVNSSGLIEEMAINVPRLEYPLIDGVVNGCPSLKLEPQRTNLITYSETITAGSTWQAVNLDSVINSIISPDGTLNGTKLIKNQIGTSSSWIRQRPVVVIGENYTFSIFGKIGNKSILNITYYDATSGDRFFNFDLSTQSITGNGLSNSTYVDSGIENYGNGWYRCYVVIEAQNTTPQAQVSLGENRVNSQGDFIYVWGADFQNGSYPTSYIKSNSGSTTTRNAETCDGAGDAATFNSSEGVLMAEISALADDGTYRVFGLSDGTASNRVILYYNPNSNNIELFISSGGAAQTTLSLTLTDIKLLQKIAVKYKVNDIGLWINGFEVGIDTIATMPSGLNELAFNNGVGTENFYGNTKQIQYYNSVLTESELEKLTSWTSFSDMANGQQYSII
jgi:hypothetical protein